MKKSVILSVVLSLMVSSLFANTIKGEGGNKISKALPAATSAEQEFLNELDQFYYETYVKPANELTIGVEEDQNENVVVYNMFGDVITTNKEEIPAKADVLMKEGDTVFYIVY